MRIVQTLVSAFDHVDVVALGDHWRKADSDLRIALVRNPEFAQKNAVHRYMRISMRPSGK
jgi:hypothetical protein